MSSDNETSELEAVLAYWRNSENLPQRVAIASEVLSGQTFSSWHLKKIWPDLEEDASEESCLAMTFLRPFDNLSFRTMTFGTRIAVWNAVRVYMNLSEEELPCPKRFVAQSLKEKAVAAIESHKRDVFFSRFFIGLVTAVLAILYIYMDTFYIERSRHLSSEVPQFDARPSATPAGGIQHVEEAYPQPEPVQVWRGPGWLQANAASVYSDPDSGCEYLVFPSKDIFGGMPVVIQRVGSDGIQMGCKNGAQSK